MNYKKISYLLLALLLFISNVFGHVCDDHVSPILNLDSANGVLTDYHKVMTDLPKEIQLAVKEGLLKQEHLTNYLKIQAKWDARGKVAGKVFQNSGLWRKFIENPKFFGEYASNVSSGFGTTIICHVPLLKTNLLMDTPLLTADILAGFITDSELSFIAAKNPSYLKELKKRGLLAPGKVEIATQKFNNIVEKVKEIAFKKYLKKRKIVELANDELIEETVLNSKIPSKYVAGVKKHLKEMSKLSLYFSTAGAINGVAYKGLQMAMGRVGFTLEAPYEGFSMFSEAAYFAEFSVHAYARIVLTEMLVGKTRSMVDDVFEGLKRGYMENPNGMLDANRIAMYDTMKYFFIGASTLGIYFASNLWATDVFIRWRENDFDPVTLIFPYKKELKPVMEQMETNLNSIQSDAQNIEFEIQEELSKMEDYQWWANLQ